MVGGAVLFLTFSKVNGKSPGSYRTQVLALLRRRILCGFRVRSEVGRTIVSTSMAVSVIEAPHSAARGNYGLFLCAHTYPEPVKTDGSTSGLPV